jgi:hypothetical protein
MIQDRQGSLRSTISMIKDIKRTSQTFKGLKVLYTSYQRGPFEMSWYDGSTIIVIITPGQHYCYA